ncbi:hypothetical protein [Legionella sp. W05-934-2]|uniref:hypothetical protein n=1 Tax=Legionella sp. W05-934-2 TaxID=1198649 RepID=UPI0034632245
MPLIYFKNGTLYIEEDKPISEDTLPSHLRKKSHLPSDETPINIDVYSQCKHFLTQECKDPVLAVKINRWKNQYLSLFLGLILKEHHSELRELDFSSCALRDSDIPALILLLREYPGIEVINLNHNYISNEGAITLLHAILELDLHCEFDLSHNDVGHKVNQYIQSILGNFSDSTMDLSENQNPDEIELAKEKLTEDEQLEASKLVSSLAKEFTPGDFLYGLHSGLPPDKGRNPIYNALLKTLPPHDRHQLLIINPFSDWVINRNDYEKASKHDFIFFDEFRKEILPSLYPQKPEPFVRGWSEHKLLCKLGILWAKKNHNKIHYVLDDIDMALFSAPNRNRADVSVTESELKFIARYYDNLKDCVQFWRTNSKTGVLEKADAPWINPETKKFWDNYLKAEHRKMRYFPKGELPESAFISSFVSRKSYSMQAFKEALNLALSSVFQGEEDKILFDLVSNALLKIETAEKKYDLESIIFSLYDEYFTNHANLDHKNKVLETVLNELVVNATFRKNAPSGTNFFYRGVIQANVYGDRVLNNQALFDMADEIHSQKSDAITQTKKL